MLTTHDIVLPLTHRPKPLNMKKKKQTPAAMSLEFGLMIRSLFFYQDSWPFRAPVDPAEVPDYAAVISAPMDLVSVLRQLCSLPVLASVVSPSTKHPIVFALC